MPPRAHLRIQGANTQTRWTLADNQHPILSPAVTVFEEDVDTKPGDMSLNMNMLQANGYHPHHDYDDQPLPRYEAHQSYDGSQYSMQSGDNNHVNWKPPESVNGGEFDAFDFHTDDQQSISLNTHVRAPNANQDHDVVGRHLLYETALMDTQSFEILDIGEVDSLKKEQSRLNSKIEATQRKLALESKVRDAAQNLQRLYSSNKRPDTPQSPESPKKSRNSLLPGRQRTDNDRAGGGETFQQADSELSASVKKVDDLHEQMRELLDRRQFVERKLLRHTAAVLAEEANKVAESAVPGLTNGHHYFDEDHHGSYTPNDFDGIRDILHGMPAGASSKAPQNAQQLEEMQERLEQLNFQLRNVISEAGQTLGRPPTAELGLDQSDDSGLRLENRFMRLENNLHTLQQQQHDLKAYSEDAGKTQHDVEYHLEGLNGQLHSALLLASGSEPVPGLEEPPRASGEGCQHQIQYMEEGLMTMEQLLQSRNHSGDLLDAQAKAEEAENKSEEAYAKSIEAQHRAEALQQNLDEHHSTLRGLWDILQTGNASSPQIGAGGFDESPDTPRTPFNESYSLPAFSSQVQHVFDKAQSAREQQDILRRQIQQQRELNGKSDAEKDRQLTDLQGQHDDLNNEHSQLQQELANVMVKHQTAETTASESRTELVNVMNEVEELRRTVESKQQERDDVSRQASTLQQHIQELEAQIDEHTSSRDMAEQQHQQIRDLEAQIEQLTGDHGAAEQKHADMHKDMENLESEVVRLTTELTMAKAELDGAYGTRKERAGAQAAEVEVLIAKNKETADELEKRTEELQSRTDELEKLRSEAETLRGSAKSAEHASQLERELQEMTNEFQELTKESIELEKEREQLDALIDSLRDRCDSLETQLSDEKVRWMGVTSPTNGEKPNVREPTSMAVLRSEFKKMMREQRAEGVKLLRAEQEERRRMEGELRKIRQANGPLAKSAPSTGTGTPAEPVM